MNVVLNVIDKVEDKYFSSDLTVAPGGWCCHCWCCCSIDIALAEGAVLDAGDAFAMP